MRNTLIKRFNGSYRRDALNATLFENLWQVKQFTKEYFDEYNNRRTHKSLFNLAPEEVLLKCGQLTSSNDSSELPTAQLAIKLR
ncbi:MAG: transposase [Bacteroidia bacterium]|nr:transposase [Bacteroidia bacterium]